VGVVKVHHVIHLLVEEAYQSCPYGNQLYDTCNDEIRPANLSFSNQFMREVSTSASSIYFRGFLAGYAQRFTMINDYQQLEVSRPHSTLGLRCMGNTNDNFEICIIQCVHKCGKKSEERWHYLKQYLAMPKYFVQLNTEKAV